MDLDLSLSGNSPIGDRNVQLAILNNSLVGIALVKNRKIVQINRKMLDIFGYGSPKEMLGKSTRIVYRSEDDYLDIGKVIYSSLREGKEARTELLARRKDGSDVWCLLSGKAVNPEELDEADSVWIFQDIDELKKQEIYLKSNVYRTILNNSLVGIILLRKRRFVQVNKKMAEMFGYGSPEEMLGKYSRILYRSEEDFLEIGGQAYSTISAGSEFKLEHIFRRNDGSDFWCLLTGKSVNPDEMDDADSVWIFQDIDEKKRQEIQLERVAYYDPLTGLPNRRMFEDHIKKVMARKDSKSSIMALCFMDLDGFKPINDDHGHDAGDKVLTVVAERLSSSLRKSDIITRVGGDEFIMLLENLSGRNDLDAILPKIENLVREPIYIDAKHSVSVGVSIGVSLFSGKYFNSFKKILGTADKAMYSSKKNKTSRLRSWTVQEMI